MKILRSILAIIFGALVTMIIITAVETANFLIFKPAEAPGYDDLGKLFEWISVFQSDPENVCAWVRTLPIEAMAAVLVGWSVAAFAGGWVCARIAGWAYLLHAGLMGALVLAGTAMNFYEMKYTHNLSHPDWMIVLGLLLPLPSSLLAGKIVAMCNPPTPSSGS